MNESQLQKFTIIVYIPEILKYIQIKDLLILIVDLEEGLIGLVL